MGRPIKSIYFGNRNTDEVGGEALYTTGGNVALTFTGNLGFGYYDANVAATFSAPTVTGGTTAVADAVYLHANGAIKSVHVSNAGTGYTGAATLTFTGANVAAPATTTANASPSTTTTNAIAANAWVAGDTVGRTNADVVKQTGGKTYRVATSGGTGKCKLVTTATPAAAGEMTITATFADGTSTFSVAKLTENLAFDADGNRYRWTLSTASNAATPPLVTISSN
jgi:hypothetical protein